MARKKRLTANSIIDRVESHHEATEPLRRRMEEDFQLYKLDPYDAGDGFQSYTSNEPSTFADKVIDYLVGSPHITPKNEEKHFLEKIWRLPEITQCFTAPNFDVVINSLPASKNGFITFGSMNKITKVNDNVISLWSKVLFWALEKFIQ